MSILNLLMAARNAFAEWRFNERAYGDLLALNDHILADVGLDRSQIPMLCGYEGRADDERRSRTDDIPSLAPAPIHCRKSTAEPARSRPARTGIPSRRTGAVRLMMLATAIGAATALPASAAQLGTAARYGINPTQPYSVSTTSPLQQQMQQDYRTNLLAAQRDLLQANLSGLGRQQVEIQHQLDTMPP